MTDGDSISRDFMKKMGATCIAKRSETGELVAILSIDNLQSAEKTTINPEKTTITDGDLISRVKNIIRNDTNLSEAQVIDLLRRIDELPSAEKTSEWRIVGKTTLHYECSKCGGAGDKWDKFCKNCGARMKEEEE